MAVSSAPVGRKMGEEEKVLISTGIGEAAKE
jgi:hypothetical protein